MSDLPSSTIAHEQIPRSRSWTPDALGASRRRPRQDLPTTPRIDEGRWLLTQVPTHEKKGTRPHEGGVEGEDPARFLSSEAVSAGGIDLTSAFIISNDHALPHARSSKDLVASPDRLVLACTVFRTVSGSRIKLYGFRPRCGSLSLYLITEDVFFQSAASQKAFGSQLSVVSKTLP